MSAICDHALTRADAVYSMGGCREFIRTSSGGAGDGRFITCFAVCEGTITAVSDMGVDRGGLFEGQALGQALVPRLR